MIPNNELSDGELQDDILYFVERIRTTTDSLKRAHYSDLLTDARLEQEARRMRKGEPT